MPDLGFRIAQDKQRLLADLLPEVDLRRRRHHLRRTTSMVALVVVALAIAVLRRTPAPVRPDADPYLPAPPAAAPGYQVIADDPGILARVAVRGAPGSATVVRNRPVDDTVRIDDRSLCEWLLRAGHPAGYIRSGSRFELTNPIGE
ncbi:MAG: hypothetical protein U1F36_23280 [Planctomycetota bacterium]